MGVLYSGAHKTKQKGIEIVHDRNQIWKNIYCVCPILSVKEQLLIGH